ncbi:mrps17p [Saccharomyces arboricola H-6]|uniref:Mrps17p n=1 Tax=Saccharomyces arboricola (strain H-6 / AS 2.3317 / CBS 10644) TaxID=1160507 RepID=J8Q9A9_SACAR|nr:mrps17p [Saccharomyces arboricola H-6]
MARQNFLGLVVSQGKMQKTVKVRVERKVFNKKINKELFHRKDYLVHDEGEISREGDLVRIEATRPLSKRKFFAIAEIIRNKGQQFALYESEAQLSVAKEEAQKVHEFLDKRTQREKKLNEKSTLLRDIRIIQDALSKGSTPTELSEIKQRYGIQEFSQETVRQLLQLDVSELEVSLKKQRDTIGSIQSRTSELLLDDMKCNQFLKDHGVENPLSLQKNIKKNLLRKHVMMDLQQASQ